MPVENKCIHKEKNEKFSGSFGKVANNMADITFSKFFITYDLFHATEFSSFVAVRSISFIIKQEEAFSWQSIIKPFAFQIWLTIFVSTALSALFLTCVIYYDKRKNETGKIWTRNKTIWFMFASITNQGGDLKKIVGIPSRLTVGIWILAVFVLTASYSGCLMAFETTPVLETVPTSFHELASAVKNGEISCGTWDQGAIYTFILNSKFGDAKIIKDHIVLNNNFFDIRNDEIAISKLQNGRFALIADRYELTQYASLLKGKWFVSDDSIVTFIGAYAIRKGFPYKKDLDTTIIRLYEAGIIDYIYKVNTDQCVENDVGSYKSLDLEELLGAFILVVIGYITSVVIFILEINVGRLTI
ncbi:glutamate receptor ionotropic, delta-1-like [Centruroides vittatus]|uniref:glutamate receptor ionotropic, delta-1-like n=1 Tax=Centruroides vittatus TaxID=120091 RepID=UPI00350F719B